MQLPQASPGLRSDASPRIARPWYSRLLLGVSAWLTTCLLLAFFAILLDDWLEANTGLIVAIGLLCCAGGLGILRTRRDDFFSQTGAALVLVGLALLMTQARDSGAGVWCAVVVLTATFYFAAASVVYRFLIALALACALWGLMTVLYEGSWFNEAAIASTTAIVTWLCVLASLAGAHPARLRIRHELAPLVLGLAGISTVMVWSVSGLNLYAVWQGAPVPTAWHLLALAACALLPVVFWVGFVVIHPNERAVAEPDAARVMGSRVWWVTVVVFVLGIPWFMAAPGVALGLAWLLVGFATMQIAVLCLGGVALLTYLARFYYLLDFTLLQKAVLLAIAGAVCLVIAACLSRTMPRQTSDSANTP